MTVFKLVAEASSKIAATDKVKLSATYDGSKDVADDSAWKSLVESWATEPSAAEPKAILDYGGSLFKDGFTKEWLWDTFAIHLPVPGWTRPTTVAAGLQVPTAKSCCPNLLIVLSVSTPQALLKL